MPSSSRLLMTFIPVLLTGCVSSAAATLLTPPSISTGITAVTAARADFNGDGRIDLVVLDTAQNIRVMLGGGNGTFGSPIASSGPAQVKSLTVADFNTDGHLDLAVLCDTTVPSVVILLGSGVGTFTTGTTVAFTPGNAARAGALSTGDVNSDGFADLVVTGQGVSGGGAFGALGTFLGKGDGTFRPQIDQTFSTYGYDALAIEDFDLDGKRDVAVTRFSCAGSQCNNSGVQVLKGDGAGHFTAAFASGVIPGQTLLSSLAIADFNGDLYPDVVAGLTGVNSAGDVVAASSPLQVLLAHGNAFDSPLAVGSALNCRRVIARDLNNDSSADLMASSEDGLISFIPGNGDGNFQPQASYQVDGSALSLLPGDYQNDGLPDAIVTDAGSPRAFLISGTTIASRVFAAPVRTNLYPTPSWQATFPSYFSMSTGDFNLDGKLDVVLGSRSTIAMYGGMGNGRYLPITQTSTQGCTADYLAVRDMDKDGKQDLVVTSSCGLRYFRGLAGAAFAAPVAIKSGLTGLFASTGDFNNDGRLDIAATFWNTSTNEMSGRIFLQNSAGAFVETAPALILSGGFASWQAVGDYNRDGKLDVAYSIQGSSVQIALGDGAGHLTLAGSTATNAQSMVAADLNGDGKLDIATPFEVMLGTGTGTLQTPLPLPQPGGSSIQTADLNHDGKLDLVVGLLGVKVYLGHGDGTFSAPESVMSTLGVQSLRIGDFTSDGRPDVVVLTDEALTDTPFSFVTVLENAVP